VPAMLRGRGTSERLISVLGTLDVYAPVHHRQSQPACRLLLPRRCGRPWTVSSTRPCSLARTCRQRCARALRSLGAAEPPLSLLSQPPEHLLLLPTMTTRVAASLSLSRALSARARVRMCLSVTFLRARVCPPVRAASVGGRPAAASGSRRLRAFRSLGGRHSIKSARCEGAAAAAGRRRRQPRRRRDPHNHLAVRCGAQRGRGVGGAPRRRHGEPRWLAHGSDSLS
jgi:hypothetical protein